MIRSIIRPFRAAAMAAVLLTTGAAASLAMPAPAAQAAVYSLSQGDSGANVSTLQSSLKKLGYFTYPNITGYYGPITAAAVQRFQLAYGLGPTGSDDAVTSTAISRAVLKQGLIADTYSYMRTPYVWGGTTPSGFDCSGFVYFMFTKFGVSVPRTSAAELYKMGFAVSLDYLRPGDLVFFDPNEDGSITHVGFYIGGGNFISATHSAGIYVQSLSSSYWGPRYIGARRIY